MQFHARINWSNRTLLSFETRHREVTIDTGRHAVGRATVAVLCRSLSRRVSGFDRRPGVMRFLGGQSGTVPVVSHSALVF